MPGGRQHTFLPHRERIAAACSTRASVLPPQGHSKRYRHAPSTHPTAAAAAAWSTHSGLVHSLSLQCTAVVPGHRRFTGRGAWRASGFSKCLSSSSSSSSMEATSSEENVRGGEEDVLGSTPAAIAPGEGNRKRVVVGMSGGVDSSVVAMLLQQQVSGCRVDGRHHAHQWTCV